jgi:GntR family transcriptional regulator
MPDPMWKQIAEDLRQKIESGELGADGAALPTELELQDTYSASRNTVRDAVKWLAARNLVYTRSGQGTFVTPKAEPYVTRLITELPSAAGDDSKAFTDEVVNVRRQPTVSVPRVEIMRAAGLPAEELELQADAMVVSRQQQRYIDGVPFSRQMTFYPIRLVERGATRLISAEDIVGGAVRYLEHSLDIQEAGWRDRITVRLPDQDEVAFFGLPDDGRIAVFEIIRTGYDKAGKPLRMTVTTYPADRNQFVMESGQVPPQET